MRKEKSSPQGKNQRSILDWFPPPQPCQDRWQPLFFQVHSFSKLTWTKWMNKDLSDCIDPAGNRWECQQGGSERIYLLKFQGSKLLLATFSLRKTGWVCPGWGLDGSGRGSAGMQQAWGRRTRGEKKMQTGSWMFLGTGLTHKIFPLIMPYQANHILPSRAKLEKPRQSLLQTRAKRKPSLVNGAGLPKLILS